METRPVIFLVILLFGFSIGNNENYQSSQNAAEKCGKCRSEFEAKRDNTEIDKLKADIQLLREKQQQDIRGGATYTRFGRHACNKINTETVYTGQVGGGHYTHSGSSVNYVCLPIDPDYAHRLDDTGNYDYIYGTEYEMMSDHSTPRGMRTGLLDHDAPCAVCRVLTRSSLLMIPGRKRCYNGWTKEYDGYLMSGFYGHEKASEYACVDRYAETIRSGAANYDGALFYPVRIACGSLICPPYKDRTAVPCVVCTK